MRILIGLGVLFIASCNLYEKDEKLLAEHRTKNNEMVRIYYVQMGATATDVIQVRMKRNDKDTVIKSFERNLLKSSRLITDSILEVVLSDTGYHNNIKRLDTIHVQVK